MKKFKPIRLIYRIYRVGHLDCLIENRNLMWYQSLYITPSLRGKGYAKWFLIQSIREFNGTTEADLLNKVCELPSIFSWLGFSPDGKSNRYLKCSLWRLIKSNRKLRKFRNYQPDGGFPILNEVLTWETPQFRWVKKTYKFKTSEKGKVDWVCENRWVWVIS